VSVQQADLWSRDAKPLLFTITSESANGLQTSSTALRDYGANKTKHKVFEDGYDSKIIQTQKFFLEKLKYIHNNPCAEKWRLADASENYKHSSASNYILGKGVYKVDMMEL